MSPVWTSCAPTHNININILVFCVNGVNLLWLSPSYVEWSVDVTTSCKLVTRTSLVWFFLLVCTVLVHASWYTITLDCILVVFRYYSSWLENYQLFIQFEYCNGGSLHDAISSGVKFQEAEAKQLMLQVIKIYVHLLRVCDY